MNVNGLKCAILVIKRNIANLRSKAERSEKAKRQLEKFERRLESKKKQLEECGINPDTVKRKPKPKKKFKYAEYTRYINSSAWASRKEKYYECHEKHCRSCGADNKEIHLHHRTYDRLFKEEDGDLVPLCGSCHAGLHKLQKVMDITVEDATNAWLSCINNNSKKKRIRSAVRGLKMRRMLKILSAVNANSPEGFMEAFISRIMKDDEVMNQAPIPTNLEVDFGRAVRTGETEKYDKKIDAMMSKLSKKKA